MTVVGGGIVGLAIARTLLLQRLAGDVEVLEKDSRVGQHQSAHNSGVVHAGLHYTPGLLKARLCVTGRELLRMFCVEHGVEYEACGKVVVALNDGERSALGEIASRAQANGVRDARVVSAHELREIEPHVDGVAAVWSPTTAIVDFPGVCQALARDVVHHGGAVTCDAEVAGIENGEDQVVLTVVRNGEPHRLRTGAVILCGGLQNDRLAMLAGGNEQPKIIPFRGEYYSLGVEHRHLVRGLIYPVPDSRYPFLGIHLTRHVSGSVLVGPNAILALSREGYRWRDVDVRDLADTFAYRGFWTMARENWRVGIGELHDSLSKRAFASAARRYVPALHADYLQRAPAGVRAQALARDGKLVDDFVIERSGRVVAIRNAPSPAATSSLAIALHVAELARQARLVGGVQPGGEPGGFDT